MLSREATNTNFIVFGLTQLGLEPKIYRTLSNLPPLWLTIIKCNFNIQIDVLCSLLFQIELHWFSQGTPASSTTKTGRHDIAEILLKVVLNTIKSIKSKLDWDDAKESR